MTAKEMSDEFDLLYDAATQEAPELDEYEKSVFLSKGLYELAEKRHEEYLKRASRGFHDDELNRDALKGFIASAKVQFEKTPIEHDKYKIKNSETTAGIIPSLDEGTSTDYKTIDSILEHTVKGSSFFVRPKDSLGVLYEDVTLSPVKTESEVYNTKLENKVKGKPASVVPVRYDHVLRLMKNPFTKPTPEVAFRLDHSDYDGGSISEIICDPRYKCKEYRVKYIRRPYPIILVDLEEKFKDMDLSIEGYTKPYSEPKTQRNGTKVDENKVSQATNVDLTLHHDIVQRGVELAILHYRENSLQNNMQAKIK